MHCNYVCLWDFITGKQLYSHQTQHPLTDPDKVHVGIRTILGNELEVEFKSKLNSIAFYRLDFMDFVLH